MKYTSVAYKRIRQVPRDPSLLSKEKILKAMRYNLVRMTEGLGKNKGFVLKSMPLFVSGIPTPIDFRTLTSLTFLIHFFPIPALLLFILPHYHRSWVLDIDLPEHPAMKQTKQAKAF